MASEQEEGLRRDRGQILEGFPQAGPGKFELHLGAVGKKRSLGGLEAGEQYIELDPQYILKFE